MFVGGSQGTGHPYPVPYRALTPKADECTNLLVPVCFSASYIAYASARMEPVFCVLGESAGVAASQAVKASSSVQDIDFRQLRSRLLERGQVLDWTDELAQQARKRPKHDVTTGEWASLQEWSDSKPGWEWLFPFIDTNKDGKISLHEHEAFQDFKKRHPGWQKELKAHARE